MIDIHFFVYVGTLAIFIIGALAVGVLAVVVFTVLATVVAVRREQRRSQTTAGEPPALQDFVWSEGQTGESSEPSADEDHTVGQMIVAARPGKPRLVQHTRTNGVTKHPVAG